MKSLLAALVCCVTLASIATAAETRDPTKCDSRYLEECEMITYVCKDRYLGTQFFTGASKQNAADWIALMKAQRAGYSINDCDKVQ